MKNQYNIEKQLSIFMIIMLVNSYVYQSLKMNPLETVRDIKKYITYSQEKSNIMDKLNNDVEKVQIAFAKSNSEFKSKINAYPAINVIQGLSYWCSEGNHKENEIVYLDIYLNENTIIYNLIIDWIYPPSKYKIEFSNDNINFITVVNWSNPNDFFSKNNNGLNRSSLEKRTKIIKNLLISTEKSFKGFPFKVNFSDSPFFAKILRISMKNSDSSYFGIRKIEVYSKIIYSLIKWNLVNNTLSEKCLFINDKNPKIGSYLESIYNIYFNISERLLKHYLYIK